MCQLSAYNSDCDIKETLQFYYFFKKIFKELQTASRPLPTGMPSIKLRTVLLKKENMMCLLYSRWLYVTFWDFTLSLEIVLFFHACFCNAQAIKIRGKEET